MSSASRSRSPNGVAGDAGGSRRPWGAVVPDEGAFRFGFGWAFRLFIAPSHQAPHEGHAARVAWEATRSPTLAGAG